MCPLERLDWGETQVTAVTAPVGILGFGSAVISSVKGWGDPESCGQREMHKNVCSCFASRMHNA